MSAYQGEFDGLCGMYAIANAYDICGYGETCEELFHVACGALAQQRWPRVLREGTSFGDMRKMLLACQAEVEKQYDELVEVRYPFLRKIPNSNQSYWQQLSSIFAHEKVHCCIVGREKPSPHWIVTYPDTERRFHFVDSTPRRSNFRKNRAQIHAGTRRRHKNQWRFDRQELIIFLES